MVLFLCIFNTRLIVLPMFKLSEFIKQCMKIWSLLPVYIPDRGVLTPLELLTAALEKDAFTGYDPQKEPKILQRPTAIIS